MRTGIPKAFQLAGHTVTVRSVPAKRWPHGEETVGIWLPGDYRIEIVGSARGTNRQQIFCHELVHAMLEVSGHSDLSSDEAFVDRLGHLLQQVLTTMEFADGHASGKKQASE